MTTAALVLAAGAGSRMGGRPKALLRRPDGRSYVEHAVEVVRAAGCAPVMVVVGAQADEVRSLIGGDAEVVEAPDWQEGMGASVRRGLVAMEGRRGAVPEAVLVTLVDLPDVGTDVALRLLAAAAEDGAQALVRTAYGGVPGHPVVLGRDHWAGVRALASGDRGARDYLRAHAHRLVECGDIATGRDVDTPADLAREGGG
jgi:CTP:molybdopterin cytidylyltransferase MocA